MLDVSCQELIVIKYGEIALKGANRHFFESCLIDNIVLATGLDKKNVQRERGRIYLHVDGDAELKHYCLKQLTQVFGIVSFVVAWNFEDASIEAIQGWLADWLSNNYPHPMQFRVSTRRANPKVTLTSMEVDRQIGSYILSCLPGWSVDLTRPQINIILELRAHRSLLYLEQQAQPGPGGLPVGVSGRALLLLSGGIDSPVAGWSILKRGMDFDALYFHSPPYVNEKVKTKIKDLLSVLKRWQAGRIRLYMPSFSRIQETINKTKLKSFWTVLHRRAMLKIADRIAGGAVDTRFTYDALVTGDNLGQVASQTVHNMGVIGSASHYPILRPLLTWDKIEIVNMAKQLGTFDISIRPYADCCSIFSPKHPSTKTVLKDIIASEERLDLDPLIHEALSGMEIIQI